MSPGAVHRCHVCNQTLPLDRFARDASRASGLQNRCRDCNRSIQHRYSDKNRARGARYRSEHSDKRLAHRAVERAVKSRDLLKPRRCQQCQQKKRVDAHHADYAHRLEVAWLCRACHAAMHRAEIA